MLASHSHDNEQPIAISTSVSTRASTGREDLRISRHASFREHHRWSTRGQGLRRLTNFHSLNRRDLKLSQTLRTPDSGVLVSKTIQQLRTLRAAKATAAASVPLATAQGGTPLADSVKYVRDLSQGMRSDQEALAASKKTIMGNRTTIFKVGNLPPGTQPSEVYPSASTLATFKAFGKSSLCKSYCVCPNLMQITVFLWKSGFLDVAASNNLAQALPRGKTALTKLRLLERVDFRSLQLLPLDFDPPAEEEDDTEVSIRRNKRTLRDACLLHYNMDLAAVQRYCGGRWMGEHHRTEQMMRVMSHILPDKLFLELGAGKENRRRSKLLVR